jgi:hypothetical protein
LLLNCAFSINIVPTNATPNPKTIAQAALIIHEKLEERLGAKPRKNPPPSLARFPSMSRMRASVDQVVLTSFSSMVLATAHCLQLDG